MYSLTVLTEMLLSSVWVALGYRLSVANLRRQRRWKPPMQKPKLTKMCKKTRQPVGMRRHVAF